MSYPSMTTTNSPFMSRSETHRAGAVEDVIGSFGRGEPVLVHDAADREGETDLIYPAGVVTPDAVARMRNDAGGLVCVALSDAVCAEFDLPFAQEIIDHPVGTDLDLAYDDRSSFSLTINHSDTYTGITDRDRSLTITTLADAAADPEEFDFATEFHAPGHVHLLRAAPELLSDRQGHTELGLALANVAEQPPAVVVCEMLDGETGEARSPASARAYAQRHDLAFVEGNALIERLD